MALYQFFFFNDTATTEIYTLSLHDALPISSTRSLSSSHRNRAPQPCTCNSRPGLAFSSPTAAATSLERTVVFVHRGSVSVVDATYLGFVFNAVQIGLSPGSSHVPQDPAKIS